MSFTIETLHAFVLRDAKDEEGLLGIKMPGTDIMMPMVAADERRLSYLVPLVQANFPDVDYKIIKFSVRTDVTQEVMTIFGKPQ